MAISIYPPPRDGLPFLVVTITKDGVYAFPAKSRIEARVMAAERSIRAKSNTESKPWSGTAHSGRSDQSLS
jgi:hypothetical protein